MEQLPTFRYHPDPIKTGSIVPSENACRVCGRKRGYIYAFSVYGPIETEDLAQHLCPWCIADGSAHEKFDISFVDYLCNSHIAVPQIPSHVFDEIRFRTPGFAGWQSECWWTHHDDGAAFLGVMGFKELSAIGDDAVDAIRRSIDFLSGDDREEFIRGLHVDGGSSAYLFQCLHCQMYGGYVDFL
ncbi:MAG: CbrC family protein [Chloroflexota bacterium]